MRILIIEDYDPLRRTLLQGLREAGHIVDASANGLEGLWYLREFEFDVLVLDLMLPGLDGLRILEKLRRDGSGTRVLVLTAKDTVADRVAGLDKGADDYLVKPFAFAELLARIHALARRSTSMNNSEIEIGDLRIDTRNRRARWDDAVLALTPKEYSLLEFLARNRGRVMSRNQIWNNISDSHGDINSNVIDVFVRSLRRKLTSAGAPPLIMTKRGYGYTIEGTK